MFRLNRWVASYRIPWFVDYYSKLVEILQCRIARMLIQEASKSPVGFNRYCHRLRKPKTLIVFSDFPNKRNCSLSTSKCVYRPLKFTKWRIFLNSRGWPP